MTSLYTKENRSRQKNFPVSCLKGVGAGVFAATITKGEMKTEKKEERGKVTTEIRKGGCTVYNLFLLTGVVGAAVGLIMLFVSFSSDMYMYILLPTSIPLIVVGIILTVLASFIKAMVFGFAQLVENSNIRTFRENPDDPEM